MTQRTVIGYIPSHASAYRAAEVCTWHVPESEASIVTRSCNMDSLPFTTGTTGLLPENRWYIDYMLINTDYTRQIFYLWVTLDKLPGTTRVPFEASAEAVRIAATLTRLLLWTAGWMNACCADVSKLFRFSAPGLVSITVTWCGRIHAILMKLWEFIHQRHRSRLIPGFRFSEDECQSRYYSLSTAVQMFCFPPTCVAHDRIFTCCGFGIFSPRRVYHTFGVLGTLFLSCGAIELGNRPWGATSSSDIPTDALLC